MSQQGHGSNGPKSGGAGPACGTSPKLPRRSPNLIFLVRGVIDSTSSDLELALNVTTNSDRRHLLEPLGSWRYGGYSTFFEDPDGLDEAIRLYSDHELECLDSDADSAGPSQSEDEPQSDASSNQ